MVVVILSVLSQTVGCLQATWGYAAKTQRSRELDLIGWYESQAELAIV
jgi:hypothetical protein